MPMPEDFAAWTASILCNDCNQARSPEQSGLARAKAVPCAACLG